MNFKPNGPPGVQTGGFTLAEIVISMSLAAITLSAMITGYVMSAQRAEWSSYSLAAQSLAMQRLEQCRACKWDPLAFPAVDELVTNNFPAQINVLDIPISGTNMVYATNFTAISTITANPPLKQIRVDCVWRFMSRGLFTNTTLTYRAPDQ